MGKTKFWHKIFLIVVIGFFLAACATVGGTKITMNYEKYSPSFRSADYAYMKGKKVVLASFHNQAQNTKTWGYYSADNKYTYESNDHLQNYFWYCFERAFKYVGVKVLDYQTDGQYYHHRYWWGAPGLGAYSAPKGVSEFQLILTSVTDQEFKFKVLVFKNGETKMDKSFSVTIPPAGTDEVPELEKRAYSFVDVAFTTIMKDRDFRRVF